MQKMSASFQFSTNPYPKDKIISFFLSLHYVRTQREGSHLQARKTPLPSSPIRTINFTNLAHE